MRPASRRSKGFTLVELLVVSAVIAVVAAGALSVVAMVTRERLRLETATDRAVAERLRLERAIERSCEAQAGQGCATR